MTSNNKEELQKSETPKTHHEAEQSISKESAHSATQRSSKIPALALMIALAAMALALYTMQINKNSNEKLLDKNKYLIQTLEQLKSNQSHIENQIQVKINEAQQAMHNKIEALNKTLHSAMTQKLYQNQDWLLLKARYCLELAQINAHWSDNNSTSIALLQQADSLLGQLSSPPVYNIRQIIATNLAQLKTIPTLDSAGLLSKLDALQIEVDSLNVPSIVNTGIESNSLTDDKQPSWKKALQNSLNTLQKLVVVRRVDNSLQSLMTPLYKSMLTEAIKLNLQEAQWAILNKNTAVYQFTLKQAMKQLKTTFKSDSSETIAIINQLKELEQITLVHPQPQIGEAIPLLNELIDANESKTTQNNNSKGEQSL